MPDFDDILDAVSRRLPAAGVECLLIGGFAVNHYGYTRNTLDVDFMIASEQLTIVRREMIAAGFTNVSIEDHVAFFHDPKTSLRADFLNVDGETMRKLLTNAISTTIRGHPLKVPALKDLLALKIFALAQAPARRAGKDLPDIAWLSVLHRLDPESDLRPLCEQYGTPETFDRIAAEIAALNAP